MEGGGLWVAVAPCPAWADSDSSMLAEIPDPGPACRWTRTRYPAWWPEARVGVPCRNTRSPRCLVCRGCGKEPACRRELRFIHSEVRAWISRKGSRTNFRWISSDADTLRDVWRAAPLFVTAQYNFSLRVLQNDPSLVLRHRRTWLLLIALERLPRERHALTAGMRAAAALEHHTRAPQPVPSRRLGPAT